MLTETKTLKDMTIEEIFKIHWATAQEIDKRGGRMDSYAAPHVWALVAKILREHYESGPLYDDASVSVQITQQKRKVEDIALAFAKRFNQDAGFDPLAWLDKCSPDPDMYPFSEMWDDESQ